MIHKPIISVITVVYNGEEFIEGTIKSVINQTYSNIEYIIVDGQSSDNTVDIIKQYESHIAKWISEPDKGLYDAMNKALQLATGDFVWFMNAGDYIFSPSTIEDMLQNYPEETDLFYGEMMMVDENRTHLGTRTEITTHKLPPKQLSWKSFRFGMLVPHQAFIVRRAIAPKYIENNLSADIDWEIKCLKKCRDTHYTNSILSEFLLGGVSRQRHHRALKDRFKVLRTHYGLFPTLLAHCIIFFRASLFKLKRRGKASY